MGYNLAVWLLSVLACHDEKSKIVMTFNLYNFNCIYHLIILDYLYSDQHLSNDYLLFLI